MTVGRFTSVTAVSLVALGLIASSAAAHPNSSNSTGIVSVKASVSTQGLPAESRPLSVALKQARLNTVVANSSLAFTVRVHNAGTSRAAQTAVKLTISSPRPNGPIEKTKTLAVIGPSQTKTVTFGHVGAIWFGKRSNLTVSLGTGQVKTYPVIFSLPA